MARERDADFVGGLLNRRKIEMHAGTERASCQAGRRRPTGRVVDKEVS